MLHGKLRPGFYIATVFLAAAVALLLWFLPSWLSEDILLDDNIPLPAAQKTVITVIFILVLLSWTVSLIVMIMQIVRGSLFTADASGDHPHAASHGIVCADHCDPRYEKSPGKPSKAWKKKTATCRPGWTNQKWTYVRCGGRLSRKPTILGTGLLKPTPHRCGSCTGNIFLYIFYNIAAPSLFGEQGPRAFIPLFRPGTGHPTGPAGRKTGNGSALPHFSGRCR